jgi:hypothetical protein
VTPIFFAACEMNPLFIRHCCLSTQTLIFHSIIILMSHAIAQAVSHWLHTAAALVEARVLIMWDLWWTK